MAVRGSRCSRKRRSTGHGTHRWKASRALEARCVRSAARGKGSRCSSCECSVLSGPPAGATGDCHRKGHLGPRTAKKAGVDSSSGKPSHPIGGRWP
jgi:hypothetical protein